MSVNTKDPRIRVPIGFILIVSGYIGLLALVVA